MKLERTLDYTDSDSSEADKPEESRPPSKVHRTLPVRAAITAIAGGLPLTPSTNVTTARRTPSLAASRRRVRGGIGKKQAYKAGRVQAHTMTTVERGAVPNKCGNHYNTSGRQQPKRKRWELASTTSTFDTDDPDPRPIKQHRLAAGGRQEEVWTRWRRLEPRQRRRT